jgi:hypothetical protein
MCAHVPYVCPRQFTFLGLWYCHLSPVSAPALVRLLGSGTLTELHICQIWDQILDGPSATQVGNALRANSTLTSFMFQASMWRNMDAVAALLGALTGHRSLRKLTLFSGLLEVGAAAGTAPLLGLLVAANAPALTDLDVSNSSLGDAGLRPLLDALPANTHLRTLNVTHNGMSAAFARDVLLPAVRNNTSLRQLAAYAPYGQENAFTREAEALVAARSTAVAALQ